MGMCSEAKCFVMMDQIQSFLVSIHLYNYASFSNSTEQQIDSDHASFRIIKVQHVREINGHGPPPPVRSIHSIDLFSSPVDRNLASVMQHEGA